MSPYVIGLDVGTGSTKAVAVQPSGKVIGQAQVYYSNLQTAPEYAEQDPEVIWNAFITTLQHLISQTVAPPQAISLSSCMHSLLLIDDDGKPLTPNITWADWRSAAIADALRNTPEGKTIYTVTGTPVHAMSPLCKLCWFQEHGYLKKAAKAISIKEYIWYRLFGVFEIDHAVASATGLFDVHQLQWFQPALDYCGITAGQLSTPVPTHFRRRCSPNALASMLQLPATTPFYIGASDGCLANLGSDAITEGTAAVTIGTSGAVRIASSHPIVLFPDMLFNYRLDEQTFICGGAVNNGGNVVQWLHRCFTPATAGVTDYSTLFEQAASIPAGAEGLLCLPFLFGERTPIWDEQASGAFVGIRPHHSPAHFVRAALEGICFAVYGVLKKLEAASGSIHTLQVSGGLVQAPLWMQLLADVTGKRVGLLHAEDASAIGAALLAFKAMGITHADEKPPMQTQLQPDVRQHGLYENRFTLFQELYAALKPTLHRLYAQKH